MKLYIKAICLSLILLSTQVLAVCSDFMSFVTLNEAGKVGFIEIKLLDASIPASTYNTWSVQICRSKKGECSGPLPLSSGVLSNDVYLLIPTSFIPSNEAFDILMTDSSGNTIDYLSVGYTAQRDNSCNLTYDWTASVSNSHDYRRSPDGTGNWGNAGNGNSGGNTGGGSNEGDSGVYLTISDDTVQQGETLSFTVSLSSTLTNNVTFNYQTLNNTALAGTHYNGASGTATIAANTLSTTISINTFDVGDNTTRDLNLFIDGSTNASIRDHFGNGVITPYVAPPPSCDVLFPGLNPFGTITALNSDSEFKDTSECNGITCSKADVIAVTEARIPTIPSGGVNLGSFNSNSLSDTDYNFFNSWNNSNTQVTYGDSSGTAVVYIKSSNDVILPDNTEINSSGLPANVLVVIESDTKIEIGKESEIKAFLYLVSPEIKINEEVEISGAITVETDKLVVESDSEFKFSTSDLNNFNPHGFCDEVPAIAPILEYTFDQCSYNGTSGEVIDSIGTHHGTAINGLTTAYNGQIENSVDIVDGQHHVETSLLLPSSYSVSTWFKKPTATDGNRYFVLGAMEAGGDLLYLDGQNNWLWGVYDGTGSTDGTYQFGNLDNNWHHLMLVYGAGQTQLYIDGVLVDTVNRMPSGTLKYIGTSFDEVGTSSPQGFRAPLDEFLVYDSALSLSKIQEIYNNQLAGNNYDGTPRAPVSCSSLIAEYKFEQTDFSSQINDTSGNNNHAENIFGGLSTPDGKYCRGFESESWNDYNGITDAFRAGPTINEVGIQGTISFWFNSSIDWDQGHERVLFDASKVISGPDKFFVLEIQQDGRLKFAFEDSADSDFVLIEGSNNRVRDTWYYVTVSWDFSNDSFAIYVDGTLRIQETRNTNGALGELNRIVFGDNSSNYTQAGNSVIASPYSSRGDYDEVRIYNKVLSLAEIQTDMNDSAGCESILDHFEIDTLDGEGLTCQADNITIRACADVDCNTLNTDNFTVDLLVNGAAKKTINFSGGSVNTDYTHTLVGNAALSLAQGYECRNTSGTPCDVDFKAAGFIIDNALGDGIPTQLSGKPSNVEYNARNLFIQAVKTDDNSGACVGLFPDGGDIPINLSYTCHSDSSECNNELILTSNSNPHPITEVISSSELHFNTESKAFFDINYPDAGKLILNAQKTVQVFDDEGNTENLDLSVSSNPFVVRPFAFKFDLNDASAISQDGLGAPDPNGSVFKTAGETFTLTATAVQWASGQDISSPYDGQPNDLTSVSGNTIARHFDNEQLDISHALAAPLPGNVGDFTQETFNLLSDSVLENEFKFSEVGIIDISIKIDDDDYLGAGAVNGLVKNVGRFIPAYFLQTVNDTGTLSANHNAVCNNEVWAYAGQNITQGGATTGAITYAAADAPEIMITAYNLNDVVTQNYTGVGFTKLTAAGITIFEPTQDDIQLRESPVDADDKVNITSEMNAGNDPVVGPNNGELIYTFNSTDHFIYEHNARSELVPFPANIPFEIDSIIDSDDVALYAGSSASITPIEKVVTQGVEVRFGRWLMENSFAPETQDLPMPMFIQHFNGVDYINNPAENCLVPLIANKTTLGAIGSGGLTLWDYRLVDLNNGDNLQPQHTDASVDGITAFTAGVYRESGAFPALKFSAPPPVNRQGALRVEYEVPPWLKFDWTGDGNFIDNPNATLTFGLYRGNDRIIYQREVDR
ncbi:LamG domain-containing protein [Litorilituus lipolyticus]|uniref:LamG domain-containing protein n=1 Tax=Litorilituus lipolyticus TaxID=2491017 RepID=A0A502L5Q3_9GAMM|nr:LamG domain-containing protein [Litorilituus lipolyticus]TPH17795.1 LamG domain-containing protein [Litorilituus lipolyticus]